MRLLVSGATATLRRLLPAYPDVLGYLFVPDARNAVASVLALAPPAVAADNSAFSRFDAGRFAAMLARLREAQVKPEWVSVPDVLADAVGTWRLWQKWEPVVRAFGFRPAMVLQDGMTVDCVWDFDPPAVFVGGTDGFKEGAEARMIVRWARSKGRPAHMGRVNTRQRVRYAAAIGCTSIDGTGVSRWPDINIPKLCRHVRRSVHERDHPTLFAEGIEK